MDVVIVIFLCIAAFSFGIFIGVVSRTTKNYELREEGYNQGRLEAIFREDAFVSLRDNQQYSQILEQEKVELEEKIDGLIKVIAAYRQLLPGWKEIEVDV